ncbi:hypothetical protein BOTBODRAFT_300083 [Botryobasidium botryosum FD-172 SS1]|uniref:AB hydrolase-1 domain-containing protein n=1 Tax=Botryobasidium botryosum (strain FD-172 SS1) TaxID=930990 RepID=A0A067MGR8_BOTB1|nr:hypothetical protein BOTBODRAFT_300083 [Botryobasidium botryosum FD-172 SS1]
MGEFGDAGPALGRAHSDFFSGSHRLVRRYIHKDNQSTHIQRPTAPAVFAAAIMIAAKIPLMLLAFFYSATASFVTSKDGTQIWAEAQGNPANPAVVWLHGIFSSSVVFDKLFEDQTYLDALYMVRYDIRGLGQSGKPGDAPSYASERFAEDFDAVVQAFKLNKPVVAGWSFGGSICADITTSHGAGYLASCI